MTETGVEPENGVLSPSRLGKYRGIDNLYPDVVVTPTGSTFHLPAPGGDEAAAACTEDAQYDRVDSASSRSPISSPSIPIPLSKSGEKATQSQRPRTMSS